MTERDAAAILLGLVLSLPVVAVQLVAWWREHRQWIRDEAARRAVYAAHLQKNLDAMRRRP
jgi:hypothetical protein